MTLSDALILISKIGKGNTLKFFRIGSDVIIHNEDGSIYCILKVIVKEHPEDK